MWGAARLLCFDVAVGAFTDGRSSYVGLVCWVFAIFAAFCCVCLDYYVVDGGGQKDVGKYYGRHHAFWVAWIDDLDKYAHQPD